MAKPREKLRVTIYKEIVGRLGFKFKWCCGGCQGVAEQLLMGGLVNADVAVICSQAEPVLSASVCRYAT